LIAHYDEGTVGGAFFEWSDEPAKDDILQRTMGAVSYDIAYDSLGRSSIDGDVWLADTLVEKPILYDAIRSGTFNGIAYNWNTNIFDLVGRAPMTLDPMQCVPMTTTGSVTGSSTTAGTTSGTVSGSTTVGSSTSSPTGIVAGTTRSLGTTAGEATTEQTPGSTTGFEIVESSGNCIQIVFYLSSCLICIFLL
jgi:hypothetical protein